MKNDGKVGEIPSDAPHWLDWRFDLKPEIAQKLAAACTAKLSDAQVSAAVKKLRKTVQPFLDEVQRWYRDDEVLAYNILGPVPTKGGFLRGFDHGIHGMSYEG